MFQKVWVLGRRMHHSVAEEFGQAGWSGGGRMWLEEYAPPCKDVHIPNP